jgi:cell division septation protein DedD
MRGMAQAGYQPRVMRDSDGLFKVRVGEFATRPQAQALQAELRRKLGGQPFVVEERR